MDHRPLLRCILHEPDRQWALACARQGRRRDLFMLKLHEMMICNSREVGKCTTISNSPQSSRILHLAIRDNSSLAAIIDDELDWLAPFLSVREGL